MSQAHRTYSIRMTRDNANYLPAGAKPVRIHLHKLLGNWQEITHSEQSCFAPQSYGLQTSFFWGGETRDNTFSRREDKENTNVKRQGNASISEFDSVKILFCLCPSNIVCPQCYFSFLFVETNDSLFNTLQGMFDARVSGISFWKTCIEDVSLFPFLCFPSQLKNLVLNSLSRTSAVFCHVQQSQIILSHVSPLSSKIPSRLIFIFMPQTPITSSHRLQGKDFHMSSFAMLHTKWLENVTDLSEAVGCVRKHGDRPNPGPPPQKKSRTKLTRTFLWKKTFPREDAIYFAKRCAAASLLSSISRPNPCSF